MPHSTSNATIPVLVHEAVGCQPGILIAVEQDGLTIALDRLPEPGELIGFEIDSFDGARRLHVLCEVARAAWVSLKTGSIIGMVDARFCGENLSGTCTLRNILGSWLRNDDVWETALDVQWELAA